MLSDNQLKKYADVLLWGLQTARSGKFKENDVIVVRYAKPAIPLAEVLYARLLEMRFNPVQRIGPSIDMERSFYGISNDDQLVFQAPGTREFVENLNGSIYLHAPESITHLSHIDSARIGKAAVARKCLRDILDKREEKGEFGWTLCAYPTEALAKHAGLTTAEYADQIVNACFLDDPDPIERWREIFDRAASIKAALNALEAKRFHLESDSTDLIITPGRRRKWIGISGHNIPSFELFLSPDWRGTEGVYYADQPSYRSGNYVKGVRLEFEKGRVTAVKAEEGETFVKKQLEMDEGASRLGEFSLTDRRFSRINSFMANTLFDENYGGKHGNCHVALGSSYSDTFSGDPKVLTPDIKEGLGFNDSALHWDLVNTEKKRVTAFLKNGGRIVIYEDGEFTVG